MTEHISLHEVTLPEMITLAETLASLLREGDTVTLAGPLGAGKTAFARAVIQALSPRATEVASPTFTLMQPYDVVAATGDAATLWHLDCYRLEHEKEAYELGLDEIWPHICLIEWPQIIASLLPASHLAVSLAFAEREGERDVTFRTQDSAHWAALFAALATG